MTISHLPSRKGSGTTGSGIGFGLVVLALCTWMLGAACSSGGGGQLHDAGNQDSLVIDYVFTDLPPGCPPGVANDKGVGAACTARGAQCPTGLICTCDVVLGVTPPMGTPCFCSLPSLQPCANIPAGYCGRNATCCSYMSMASLCIPNVCLDSAMCPVF